MCKNHRNPVQCILPPYIADKMKDSGKHEPEESLDNQLRNYRMHSDRKFFSALPHSAQKLMAVKKAKPVKPKPIIEVHNVNKAYGLPGKLMTTAQIAKDKNAKNVLNGVSATWDFYYSIFKRNSVDNAGMTLINSVHYGKRYNNACGTAARWCMAMATEKCLAVLHSI